MYGEWEISAWSKARLQEQGLRGCSDPALAQHRFGNRFAYVICLTMVVVGLAVPSQAWLIAANIIALLGIFPPYHPIDYIYNYGVRHLIGRPRFPRRANQARFACALATALLAGMNYALYVGNMAVLYALGGILLASAVLVSFTDLCIPSLIYNALFERKAQ